MKQEKFDKEIKKIEKKHIKRKPPIPKKKILEKYKEVDGKKVLRCQHIFKNGRQCKATGVKVGNSTFNFCKSHIKNNLSVLAKYEEKQRDIQAKNEKIMLYSQTRYTNKFWEKLKVNNDLLCMETPKLMSFEDDIKFANAYLEYIVTHSTQLELKKNIKNITELIEVTTKIKERYHKMKQGEEQTVHIDTFKLIMKQIMTILMKCFSEDKEGLSLFFNEVKDIMDIVRSTNVILEGKPIKSLEIKE